MATFDTTRSTAPATTIGGFVTRAFGALAAWNDARITRKALQSLSARELDDIGLNAGDIDQIATRGIRR